MHRIHSLPQKAITAFKIFLQLTLKYQSDLHDLKVPEGDLEVYSLNPHSDMDPIYAPDGDSIIQLDPIPGYFFHHRVWMHQLTIARLRHQDGEY